MRSLLESAGDGVRVQISAKALRLSMGSFRSLYTVFVAARVMDGLSYWRYPST